MFFYIFAGIDVLIGLFWLLSGLFTFLTGHGWPGLMMALFGMVTMVVGPIWTRIICEILIVIFLIHENLIVIRKGMADPQAVLPSTLRPNMPPHVAPSATQYVQPMMRQE